MPWNILMHSQALEIHMHGCIGILLPPTGITRGFLLLVLSRSQSDSV